jgi:predicted signal transduction protein with EAL and GGDEF domain
VEQVEQAQALRNMGCRVAQGYLFSRPVAPEALPPLLAQPLWTPPAPGSPHATTVAQEVHSRRAHRTFIDEFLDHIGVPMWRKHGGPP